VNKGKKKILYNIVNLKKKIIYIKDFKTPLFKNKIEQTKIGI